ncbi:ATP-dependent metalloprotease FtsH [Desulfonatronospira thiodismutans ASO3-1]|uniref:ATP-dependent zinc metalloprotease FtsH n=1 Tax=Desulfonatronospira thiodismutans ASO3-1 TaxID=555779 RepID=D6SL31_9BACT|nr:MULTISPECIES: ATP-dependent zinc metalloprotease FtsH [Desulfonatronospira]EFI35392.1 ATP-dependent metalloprotease FtsH [Desulfonatronospira thiodismutans ASO3-1]RQD73419.1 MAG: ATP-dependent metallopeptidase FtsH/Yme1/Tma family protein [Desulfonatronospira sp. MSAO_Bac3]
MNTFSKNLLLWATISIVLIMLFNMFNQPQEQQEKLTYTELLNKIEQGEVMAVKIKGQEVSGVTFDEQRFISFHPEDPNFVDMLLRNNVQVEAEPEEERSMLMTVFISWFPILLLIAVWIFFMRQMQGGGGKAMSFGKSKAKLVAQEDSKVTFSDVAGVDEAKDELTEVVDFLSDPKKFTRLGGRIPKGVLLVGSPGTGKTLLARAVAGEAGVPFFSISGSDFVEMFVGVGASRVRDLFVQGKKNAPCLIFIDEIDAVGRQRGAGLGGGHDEREQTLNQLLVEMDGFESNEGVILIAATNRPDVLDPALLRPGRFDRQVVVPNPDLAGRKHILEVHSRRTPLATGVDMEVIARGTPGFSGADLENLVNEAALQAAKKSKEQVGMEDFEEAKDKVLMGKERRSIILSDEEKKTTAYHEAGHTLVAKLLPGTDPIHKVSIIPRGRALGVTMQLPEDERHNYSKTYLENNLSVLLGGRVAEELVFNQMTTGAGNDIERASKMARKMVCEWGMSETLGPLSFGGKGDEVFLGREFVQHKEYSEDTAKLIDAEVKRIVQDGYDRAKMLLKENMDSLHRISEALLDRETISGKEVDKLMQGEDLPPIEEELKKDQSKSGDSKESDDGGDKGDSERDSAADQDEDSGFKIES